MSLRRAFWAGLGGGGIIIEAPATVQEADPRLFLANYPTLASIAAVANAGIAWVLEGYEGYYEGLGAYETDADTNPATTKAAYKFWFKGTGLAIEGLTNQYGGVFRVHIDGQDAGTGSIYSPTLQLHQLYYQRTGLPYEIHFVTVTKESGLAITLDQIRLF